MVLERRVRIPDLPIPGSAARQQKGECGGFGCDDDLNHHGHVVKPRRTPRDFAMKSLLMIALVAAVVLVGQEYVESRVHEVESQVHELEHQLHKVENSVQDVEKSVQQVETTVQEVEQRIREEPSNTKPEEPNAVVVEAGTKALRSEPSAASASSKQNAPDLSSQSPPRPVLFGEKITYGLYRFKAEKLGRHFVAATKFFESWIGDDVDAAGAAFAKQRVQMPGVAEFHNDCFQAPNEDRMLHLEEHKKGHKYNRQERLDFLAEEQAIFYTNTSNIPQHELVHITENRQWAWRTAALYSAQFSGTQSEFRHHINAILDEDKYLAGSISGTFWYPPNAIREWHTNAWDVSKDSRTGKMKKPWRMYYVRQKPEKGGDGIVQDRSAFHLLDGNGIPADRLESVGAYRLTNNNKDKDEPDVWRLPDQDGYVSLFRLQVDRPYRWHCIVADETVHRYSLGMSLSDDEVEALLEHIGVEL